MKEDFISYSQAVRLKKLGFDWECIAEYVVEPDGKPILVGSTAFVFRNSEEKGRDVTAPFLSQAQKWLREVKDYHINILYDKDCWLMQLVDMEVRRENIGGVFQAMADAQKAAKLCKSYEAALSAGIDAALKLLEEKI